MKLMEMHAPLREGTRELVLLPGEPFPQGATWDGEGVNFSLFAAGAEAVELCLFDSAEDRHESARLRLRERTNDFWHGYLPHLRPGQLYGYRVYGPFDPAAGLRFNANKLLLDPYAKAIGRGLHWDDAVFGYTIGSPDGDLSFDERDSAPFAPLAVVADPSFDWQDDEPPRVPWHESIIYETHVRGLTMRHPAVPENLRGTYAGLACDPVLEHLQRLGVTAVELMPVHYFLDDRHLVDRGLRNYWGYNTLGYFAPHPLYAAREHPFGVVWEFRDMVRRLHKAGIEVILDVVYNHTAEGNEMGPTLSFRGIDNLAYYRTVPGNARYYMDFTGCGNTLNMVHPHSLQLMMDSLRYWVTEMHVDGFRFDLAAALARELDEVKQLGAFFDTIYQDPTLASVKLIAEPWDLGPDGYQVGKFPNNWAEWNGRYRDTVRRFWRGDMGLHADVATRLGGSADLYEHAGRLRSSSINFITAHDGFTLADLVSYEGKHNEANLDDNRDGSDDNSSWNCGVEGETDDAEIRALRWRQMRNFLATLLLSQGVPMIGGGDEIARSQRGNNNGYCQDNELTWYDWNLSEEQQAFFDFACRLSRYRREHPTFHRRTFRDENPDTPDVETIRWLRSDGQPMRDEDWEDGGWMRTLGMLLLGDAPEIRDSAGQRVQDDDFLLLLNAYHEPIKFRVPEELRQRIWRTVFDTARPELAPDKERLRKSGLVQLAGRSMVVLRRGR
ncbi:MAG TPA: glycogen debranching protein GlgX [Candidatus Limnocylindrales bacterium]|nr:glycogen debranching protein GlgX [Candidatus Limnocylindrales bacterium]